MRRFPVICGPTAGGKSALALAVVRALTPATRITPVTPADASASSQPRDGGGAERAGAERIAAEVVSADAFQVFRGLDIGTAKPSPAERAATRHHLLDLVEPTEAFSVEQWLTQARRAIDDCRGRGVTPVVVGGTHLYVQALLHGLFEGPAPDAALRARLHAMDPAARRAELERVDPEAARRIHPADARRTVRALEVFTQTGTPISTLQRQWDDAPPRPDALLVVLDWGVEALSRRINARVRAMFDAGLVDEVRGLVAAGRLGPQAGQAIGYRQLVPLVSGPDAPGRARVLEALERVKIDTRRLAKNQRTWLNRLGRTPGVMRLACPLEDEAAAARRIVEALA